MSWDWVAKMPSTNLRIAITILLALATGIRVVASAKWDPPNDWLVFLSVWAGLDVLQFSAKRITQKPEPAPPEG